MTRLIIAFALVAALSACALTISSVKAPISDADAYLAGLVDRADLNPMDVFVLMGDWFENRCVKMGGTWTSSPAECVF